MKKIEIFERWTIESKVQSPWASSRREESIDHTFVGSRWPPGRKYKPTLDPGFRRRAPPSSHPWELGGPVRTAEIETDSIRLHMEGWL